MDKGDFGTILMWVGALLILGWAFLKIIGVIHSPIWVEMVPYIGGGAGILGVSYAVTYRFGKIMRGIEETEKKVNEVLEIKEKFTQLEHEHKLALDGKLKIKHK